jgi:hypothetical protein
VVGQVIYTGGSRLVELDDNFDGIYSKEIAISLREKEKDAKIVINIDDKDFTTIEELPPVKGPCYLGIFSGIAKPTGGFPNDFDPGYNILLNAEYLFSPHWSLLGSFGFNALSPKGPGIDPDDFLLFNVSLNAKYRLSSGRLTPYVNGGLGAYFTSVLDYDIGLGGNIGCGIDYDINGSFLLETGLDYHTVFTEDIRFLHAHFGILIRF